MPIKIFISGDVMPQMGKSEFLLSKGERIFDEMRPYIKDADISITNLEAPVISDIPTPIKKSGPCLFTSETTIKLLKNVGFNVLTLANNHFFDQGQQGVDNTIDSCNALNINIVGGGKSFSQALKPLTINCKGKQIAIINACENEFSIANSKHGGSNPLDLIQMQEDITSLRKENDYILIIVHGGVEQYQYPTPRMRRWYRHFVDLGADAVVNHHQHCINGYEVYKGSPIFYGLGNFYFPKKEGALNNTWNNGYAVTLTFDKDIYFDTIPYHQDVEAIKLRDKKEFEKEIELLNQPIADDYLLQQMFDNHIMEIKNSIKLQFLPSFMRGRLLSGLTRKGYLGKLYKGSHVYSLKNHLTCESHHESVQRLFSILTNCNQ